MQLYMTELLVRDWPRALAWYRDTLGLPILMRDDARRFALLGGESARLALKEGANGPPCVRLAFRSDRLDADHERLTSLGVACSPVTEDPTEPFRSFRLVDPDNTPIQVFAWKS